MTHQEAALKLRNAVRDITQVSDAYTDALYEVEWVDHIKGLAYAQIRLECLDFESTGSWPEETKPKAKSKAKYKKPEPDEDDPYIPDELDPF